MRKLSIFTINTDNNFGNKLQNYALQETLKKFDLRVETVLNRTYSRKDRIKNIIKSTFLRAKYNRWNKFRKFDKNIKYSKYHVQKNNIPNKLSYKYDYYITGSDQVWNPTYGRTSDIDFLTFVPKEKRNSFSASFGISEIPKENKEKYKKNLLEMNNISVREERGKEIIQELTGRKDIEVLVDPTMLLTVKEWDRVSKKPKKLKTDKYVLNYYLGELPKERKEEIEKIARKNNCEIINLMDSLSPLYACGPSEFLYLIKNAFLVCTDSFHGVVFSIIYDTPFIVFSREDKKEKDMSSRIDTLLDKFNLQYRKFNGKIDKEIFKCNYEEISKILNEERQNAQKFIKKILNT